MSAPSQENPATQAAQDYPGRSSEMDPRPRDEMRDYEGRGLLAGKRALVTGGDSGIGRAVAVAFAKEGADVAIAYLSEQEGPGRAAQPPNCIREGRHRCVTIRGDLAEEANCQRAVDQTAAESAAWTSWLTTSPPKSRSRTSPELTTEQWDRTFKVEHLQLLLDHEGGLPAPAPTGAPSSTPRPSTALRGNKT